MYSYLRLIPFLLIPFLLISKGDQYHSTKKGDPEVYGRIQKGTNRNQERVKQEEDEETRTYQPNQKPAENHL